MEQFEAAEPALRSLFSEPGVQGQFLAEVTRFARERARLTVVTAEETGPGSGDARPRDADGAAGKADALLEVAVDSVAFEQPWQFRRELVMVLSVHARLVRGVGGSEQAYEASLTYEGGTARLLTTWVEDEARALRQELARAHATLAERIVEEIFLLYGAGR